jgi:hypothetical protein
MAVVISANPSSWTSPPPAVVKLFTLARQLFKLMLWNVASLPADPLRREAVPAGFSPLISK